MPPLRALCPEHATHVLSCQCCTMLRAAACHRTEEAHRSRLQLDVAFQGNRGCRRHNAATTILSELARTFHQCVECTAPRPHQADLGLASGPEALPAAPLPLPDAVLLHMASCSSHSRICARARFRRCAAAGGSGPRWSASSRNATSVVRVRRLRVSHSPGT